MEKEVCDFVNIISFNSFGYTAIMSGYKISNQEGIYFVTFAIVEWVDVFTRKQYAEIVIESLIPAEAHL